MMMAADSTPPARTLSDATLQRVRRALVADLGSREPSDELRAALTAMAAEARASGILPERLLVLLKELWYGLPEVEAAVDGTSQTRILQRVVTICIREYYG